MNSRDRIQKLSRDIRDNAAELFLVTEQPTIDRWDVAQYLDGMVEMLLDQSNDIFNSLTEEEREAE